MKRSIMKQRRRIPRNLVNIFRIFIYNERLEGKTLLEIAMQVHRDTATIIHHIKATDHTDIVFQIKARKFDKENFLQQILTNPVPFGDVKDAFADDDNEFKF